MSRFPSPGRGSEKTVRETRDQQGWPGAESRRTQAGAPCLNLLVLSLCLISSSAFTVSLVFSLSMLSVVRNLLFCGYSLLPVVDALSKHDLPGAVFSCINVPRFEVFPAKCCAMIS